MSSTIRLVCHTPPLEPRLRAWLERTRLEPPVPLTLDVRVGDPPPAPDDGRPPFRQPGVVVRASAPGSGMHLSWDVAPAVAEIDATARTARVTLSSSAVACFDECVETFFVAVLIFLLRRAGWHHIHAATAIDPQGRGWLLAGNGGTGKSTTAALFARQGWQVGTDDTAFLAPADGAVAIAAYRAPIALRPDGYRLLGYGDGTALERRQKVGYWPEELGGGFAPLVVPDVILFTAVGNGCTAATPLGARACLAELVRWSAWVILEPDLAQEHLELMTRLARQAKGYRVTLGHDLFTRPTRLADLIP
jgi:hypothetical protein